MFVNIPQVTLIDNSNLPQDSNYQHLKIIRFQSDDTARQNYTANRYQFQHQPADYTILSAVLSRKGAAATYRLVLTLHPNIKAFTDIVRYDPAHPPIDDYDAQGMKIAHEQTQSDFKGAKSINLNDFKDYLLEGIEGKRPLYLPTISGWQSKRVFEKTIFVAFDETDPDNLYGRVYLPKAPVMQSDGQTQTGAVFAVARTIEAIQSGALDTLLLTLEIELNVDERHAAQSFADRNGRGSKKNKNLVIGLDTSSPLSQLRYEAIQGTVLEGRLADGRSTGATMTVTKYISDLSTMEQMLILALTGGNRKPEHFKHQHVNTLLPYAQEFIHMLDDLFKNAWPENVQPNKDPYRKIYVHGWAFALKAMALSYYRSRIDELGPISAAMGTEKQVTDATKTLEEKFLLQVDNKQQTGVQQPTVRFDELKSRLSQIDWIRYRHHWIVLTGYSIKDGTKRTFKVKETGEDQVVAQAQNTPGTIGMVADKILSVSWTDLCSNINEPLTD